MADAFFRQGTYLVEAWCEVADVCAVGIGDDLDVTVGKVGDEQKFCFVDIGNGQVALERNHLHGRGHGRKCGNGFSSAFVAEHVSGRNGIMAISAFRQYRFEGVLAGLQSPGQPLRRFCMEGVCLAEIYIIGNSRIGVVVMARLPFDFQPVVPGGNAGVGHCRGDAVCP